jgi:predicted transcriptional regulator
VATKKPDTALTATQHEILEVVWSFAAGATVTEIWEAISARRAVTRTTILNLVDRLEKRRWLKRHKAEDGFRYMAAMDREATAHLLANEFVAGFFGGSASSLVMSLLGNKRVTAAELENLRRLLDAPSGKGDPPKENS